jgi:hypothetical protein
MISFQETVRRIRRRLDRLVGRQDDHRLAEHYRELMERHLASSNFYQGLLFHSWRCNREQAKGLRRQAAKIKRLKQRIVELTPNAPHERSAEGGPLDAVVRRHD